jgi:hypothetical protein
MGKDMHQILDELRLTLKPEKMFVGRNHKGFDLLGYHITPNGFSPNQKTQEKALEKAKRRYAQGDRKSLQLYLHRRRIPAFARTGLWAHAGLPFKVQSVESVVASMAEKSQPLDVIELTENNRTPNSVCVLWANNFKKGT